MTKQTPGGREAAALPQPEPPPSPAELAAHIDYLEKLINSLIRRVAALEAAQ